MFFIVMILAQSVLIEIQASESPHGLDMLADNCLTHFGKLFEVLKSPIPRKTRNNASTHLQSCAEARVVYAQACWISSHICWLSSSDLHVLGE